MTVRAGPDEDTTVMLTHDARGDGDDSVSIDTVTEADTPAPPATDPCGVTPTVQTVAEGSSGSYTVVLETNPTRNVTVMPSSGDPSVVSISGPFTFTAANWDTEQMATAIPGAWTLRQSPMTSAKDFRANGRGHWRDGTIRHILTRRTPIEGHGFGRRRKRNVVKPDSEVVTAAVSPLLERESFDIVQRLLKTRGRMATAGRTVRGPTPLTGSASAVIVAVP